MRNYLTYGVLALAALAAGPAHADYPVDDDITFVIPYGPGGGFDTIVRAFTPALEKALGTTVVPENIPGASGTRGGQAVFRADPDGYTIGIYNIPGLTVTEALDRDIGFPLDEVTWIANLAESRYAVAVAADSEIESIEDLCGLGRDIRLSDTGLDSTSSITSVITFDILECPIVNVTGYSGSNDTMIAVMRGEVDATLKPISSLARYVESGDLKLIMTLTKEQVVEGVQSATDIGHPEFAQFSLNRVVGAPPGVSAEVVAKLEEGFRQAIESDAVKEWGQETGTDLRFMGAEETAAMMREMSDFYIQYQDLLTK